VRQEGGKSYLYFDDEENEEINQKLEKEEESY